MSGPQIVFAERATHRDGDTILIARVGDDGLRIGLQALEPWYGTGVLLTPDHPAYAAGLAFVAALAQAEAT